MKGICHLSGEDDTATLVLRKNGHDCDPVIMLNTLRLNFVDLIAAGNDGARHAKEEPANYRLAIVRAATAAATDFIFIGEVSLNAIIFYNIQGQSTKEKEISTGATIEVEKN